MIQPLDQVRSIVAPALSETTKVRKNFEKFFILTMSLILTIYDRMNFTSPSLRKDVLVRETVCVDGVELTVFSAVVKCKSLKRKIKVAIAELSCGYKTIRKIFFSTDTAMSASDIVRIYHSRFQIEFLLRDAKQNTGLEDWQSTPAESHIARYAPSSA